MTGPTPPPGVRERRAPDRRIPVLKVLAALGVLAVLVSGVASVVAARSSSSAETAATTASKAAQTARSAAEDANEAVRRTERNSATLADLCQVARNQRHTLELERGNISDFLASPVSEAQPELAAYVRAFTIPQLDARLESEKLPPSCERVRARP